VCAPSSTCTGTLRPARADPLGSAARRFRINPKTTFFEVKTLSEARCSAAPQRSERPSPKLAHSHFHSLSLQQVAPSSRRIILMSLPIWRTRTGGRKTRARINFGWKPGADALNHGTNLDPKRALPRADSIHESAHPHALTLRAG
jgi:hypothetical protein